ncbi:MAG: ABC transporter ATP-binding protein [Oscillospiraceae bacterium]|jgi:branched-chain amino acid transport system ATP-binding protein|nr:ABC transporter ATP-binding protein [Oscillospiraceae bacterium]
MDTDNILELRDLIVDYNVIRALKGVSMSIPRGKITVILGANGAGKTTTLRTLSGLTKVVSGDVLFEGKSIKNKPPYRIAHQGISQSPEGRLVFGDLTTEENLRVGGYQVRSKAKMKASFERVYGLFPILAERSAQQAATLSGGEQQMLAIGRALMMQPRLLLLDEPSLGLAPLVVKAIFEAIKRIAEEGVTVLMVEQNVHQSLLIADFGYVLELGKVKTQGTSAELLDDQELVSAYLGKKRAE